MDEMNLRTISLKVCRVWKCKASKYLISKILKYSQFHKTLPKSSLNALDLGKVLWNGRYNNRILNKSIIWVGCIEDDRFGLACIMMNNILFWSEWYSTSRNKIYPIYLSRNCWCSCPWGWSSSQPSSSPLPSPLPCKYKWAWKLKLRNFFSPPPYFPRYFSPSYFKAGLDFVDCWARKQETLFLNHPSTCDLTF